MTLTKEFGHKGASVFYTHILFMHYLPLSETIPYLLSLSNQIMSKMQLQVLVSQQHFKFAFLVCTLNCIRNTLHERVLICSYVLHCLLAEPEPATSRITLKKIIFIQNFVFYICKSNGYFYPFSSELLFSVNISIFKGGFRIVE